jgi:putative endonuclease
VVRVRAKDAVGRHGEALAARHLADAGLEILATNWRCPAGEIDIIARDGDTLVICEVKTRRGTAFGGPLEAVTYVKAARLRRLAAHWLATRPVAARDVRIDLVGVLLPRGGRPQIEHVRAAV